MDAVVAPSFLPSALFAALLCRASHLLQFVMLAGRRFPSRAGRHLRSLRRLLDDPIDRRPSSTLCRLCRFAPPPFVRAVAYGPYEGRMRDAIHALKYNRMHAAARNLGQHAGHAIDQLAAEAPAEMLVVPVPLYPLQARWRGFNQARVLAPSTRSVLLRKSHPNGD